MGVLEDAIREHLQLKREHGADEEVLRRQEAEALGPARRPPEEPAPPNELPVEDEPAAFDRGDGQQGAEDQDDATELLQPETELWDPVEAQEEAAAADPIEEEPRVAAEEADVRDAAPEVASEEPEPEAAPPEREVAPPDPAVASGEGEPEPPAPAPAELHGEDRETGLHAPASPEQPPEQQPPERRRESAPPPDLDFE